MVEFFLLYLNEIPIGELPIYRDKGALGNLPGLDEEAGWGGWERY